MDAKKIVNFIFELNQLKRQRHSGWMLAGVKDPDTVGEHAWRAAQIAYILAVLEGADPEKTAAIVLFHDNAETRILDHHKLAARYIDKKEAEKKALAEQVTGLGDGLAKTIIGYDDEMSRRNTPEGKIAKEADWLEQAFEAKELADRGYEAAWDWINNVEKALETASAKALLVEMKETKFTDWWQGLKKMTYTKLSEGGSDAKRTDQSS